MVCRVDDFIDWLDHQSLSDNLRTWRGYVSEEPFQDLLGGGGKKISDAILNLNF